MKLMLEVVVLPVSDVDEAMRFYGTGLDFRLDADVAAGGDHRLVQMTPPGSACSIIFGHGVTSAAPGSVDRLVLAVDDIVATSDELRSRGVEVGDVFHDAGGSLGGGFHAAAGGRANGPDPERRSYASYASFSDPDGNTWVLQELTERLPGRSDADVDVLSGLLAETAERHGAFEAVAPPHDWWDWYAAYMNVRQRGGRPDDAVSAAARYMREVKHLEVAPT